MCIHEIFANKFQGDSGSQAGMTEGLRIRFIQNSGSISVGDVDHFYLTKYSRLE
jgi:hypothetical protein